MPSTRARGLSQQRFAPTVVGQGGRRPRSPVDAPAPHTPPVPRTGPPRGGLLGLNLHKQNKKSQSARPGTRPMVRPIEPDDALRLGGSLLSMRRDYRRRCLKPGANQKWEQRCRKCRVRGRGGRAAITVYARCFGLHSGIHASDVDGGEPPPRGGGSCRPPGPPACRIGAPDRRGLALQGHPPRAWSGW
jgi:hypothetical protein